MAGKVVLTGYGGMLARDLLPALEGAGFEVTALTRAELDVVDSGAVAAALDAVQPLAVVNTAAFTDVDGAERQPDAATRANTVGPEVLARACRTRGVALAHFSTDFVFDGRADRPYREDDPTGPLGVYGQTKLQGERRIRDVLPADHLIVRTSWLYGLGGPCFPRAILDGARDHDVLDVVEDQVGCPTWTADLARATAALLTAGARGTVHAAAPDHVSRHGWAEALCDEARRHTALRVREVRRTRSERGNGRAARPAWSVLDSGRLRDLTGEGLPPWRTQLGAFVRQLLVAQAGVVLALAAVAALATAAGCNGCPLTAGPQKVPAMPVPIPVSVAPAIPPDPALDLSVHIDGTGFTVSTPLGALGSAGGQPGPTVPCREAGCPTVESYDVDELQRILAEVKTQYPEADSIVIRADPSVTYEVVVLVLDAARADGERTLFPSAVLDIAGSS